MTRERIEDMREVVLPFVKKRLLETNYEGLGKSDAEEFTRDFNEILNLAIEALEQEPRWIPVKFRPLTDEEQDEYPDYCYMVDCPMPDDGEEILVCTAHGGVEKDECGFEDGFYLDSGCDWQTDVVAWMPLPKPYEPQESEDKE